jgi:hypothetical protein
MKITALIISRLNTFKCTTVSLSSILFYLVDVVIVVVDVVVYVHHEGEDCHYKAAKC